MRTRNPPYSGQYLTLKYEHIRLPRDAVSVASSCVIWINYVDENMPLACGTANTGLYRKPRTFYLIV